MCIRDSLTTHSVYWPTMLMSLNLPLPKTIFAHGWWLTDEEKMSKSLGNVISPLMLIDEFGVDSVRYYLMSEMVLGLDATFSMDSFIPFSPISPFFVCAKYTAVGEMRFA